MGWAASPGRGFNLFLLFPSAGTKRKEGEEMGGWDVKSARIRSCY